MSSHPDNNGQFEHLNRTTAEIQNRSHQPVVSVDAQKKQLVEDFKNGAQEWLIRPSFIEKNLHLCTQWMNKEKLPKANTIGQLTKNI